MQCPTVFLVQSARVLTAYMIRSIKAKRKEMYSPPNSHYTLDLKNEGAKIR